MPSTSSKRTSSFVSSKRPYRDSKLPVPSLFWMRATRGVRFLPLKSRPNRGSPEKKRAHTHPSTLACFFGWNRAGSNYQGRPEAEDGAVGHIPVESRSHPSPSTSAPKGYRCAKKKPASAPAALVCFVCFAFFFLARRNAAEMPHERGICGVSLGHGVSPQNLTRRLHTPKRLPRKQRAGEGGTRMLGTWEHFVLVVLPQQEIETSSLQKSSFQSPEHAFNGPFFASRTKAVFRLRPKKATQLSPQRTTWSARLSVCPSARLHAESPCAKCPAPWLLPAAAPRLR